MQNLVEKFLKNPLYLGTGAGKLAKRFNVSKEEIYKAREIAKDIINASEKITLSNIILDQEDTIARLTSEKREGDEIKIEYSSKKPLSREEIEKLYGVDNISTKLSSYWNKETASGKYIVSANIKCLVKDFYAEKDFEERLKNIFTKIDKEELPLVKRNTEEAIFIYISDDHAGLKLSSSLFGNSWNKDVYKKRMQKIIEKVKSLGKVFDTAFIVRLGDEADGWNSKTTRQDVQLDSLDNKEQFDIFTEVNKFFYDNLFSSGLAEEYNVINCNNSNHSGLGLSYIFNKAIEFYIENKFPQVTFINVEEFIGGVEWGNHLILVTHGKDEKYMKSPMPLNLDNKTDLWLYDYLVNKGYSPYDRSVSIVKGDIHKFNINEGKSGRYVNVPSISGGSDWIEHNFGNSKPGALIEIYDKYNPDITSIMLRF